ncbi:HNH endonuclease [Halorubrum sp. Eb13]|uniref:HNH endonuclease n=1 Tax=Halorubrum sp. Eb13 TaxID=1383843 RepID=UPI000B99A297|nr:HNH endonuclease [Halorubrum sp. Eb13]OYR47840.1 hypothetical protein DJ75_03970 [Halorubrum sp. Eb13]
MEDSGNIKFEGSTKFCDKCGSLMKKRDDSWECPKCNHSKFESSQSESSARMKSGYFAAKIDHINDDGHGIIETEYQHINAGPIQESAVGDEVTAVLVRGNALISDEEPRDEEYIGWMVSALGLEPQYSVDNEGSDIQFCNNCAAVMRNRDDTWVCPLCDDFQFHQTPEPGEVFTAEVDRISNSGNSIIECRTGHINLGPFPKFSAGTYVTALKINSTYAFILDDETGISVEDFLIKANQSSALEAVDLDDKMRAETTIRESDTESGDDGTSQQEPQDGTKSRASKDVGTVSSGADSEDKAPDDERDLNLPELRREAQAGAVEEVPAEATTAPSESVEYNRSREVKRYVKTRAAGICEGCGSPAPFTSKTGEPYLHAHHVNELSDGGTDTIDTVIALCPNCHYRVHDGADGEQYNKRLRRILHELEARR